MASTSAIYTASSGWTLPTTKQINSITSGTSGSATYVSVFNPVLGGRYYNSNLLYESTSGSSWGSNATANILERQNFSYRDSNILATASALPNNGFYIRCVSEEKTVTDLMYMQDSFWFGLNGIGENLNF